MGLVYGPGKDLRAQILLQAHILLFNLFSLLIALIESAEFFFVYIGG